ncbi:phospholipase D family protein [Tsukamurella soli]|uniref:Phospholipase D family protein n=1 Tax=Tsukamurella soli TaxID=644556 RepID=A0ABP8K257_9ACTN
MLAPKDRTTLVEHLRPPDGAKVTRLVGTTFTLDLIAAFLPALAITGDDTDVGDSIPVLAALRNSIGVIDIFPQCGQIAVPRSTSRLLSLLEPAIHPVVAPPARLFHPKVWMLLWENDGASHARLVVATRNLTLSHSWDVVVSLDGRVTPRDVAGNSGLSSLVDYLLSHTVTPVSTGRVRLLREFQRAIARVEWQEPDRDVALHAIHVLGLGGQPPRIDFGGSRRLIISPFLGDDALLGMASDRHPNTLVSTQGAIDKLKPRTAAALTDMYILNPDAAVADDTNAVSSLPAALHAKLYVVDQPRARSRMLVGSANATHAGFNGNVEVLLEFSGPTKLIGVEQVTGKDGLGSLLVSTKPEEAPAEVVEDDETARRLAGALRMLASRPLAATVSHSDNGYTLALSGPAPASSSDVSRLECWPLTVPRQRHDLASGSAVDLTFTDLALEDVTALFVFSVTGHAGMSRSTVVIADLRGERQGRVDAIVTSMISNANDFQRLLELLLSFGGRFGSAPPPLGDDDADVTPSWETPRNELFEVLMRAAADGPDSLDRLSGVVESIIRAHDPNKVLPDGFTELWNAVSSARGRRADDE